MEERDRTDKSRKYPSTYAGVYTRYYSGGKLRSIAHAVYTNGEKNNEGFPRTIDIRKNVPFVYEYRHVGARTHAVGCSFLTSSPTPKVQRLQKNARNSLVY